MQYRRLPEPQGLQTKSKRQTSVLLSCLPSTHFAGGGTGASTTSSLPGCFQQPTAPDGLPVGVWHPARFRERTYWTLGS